MSRGQRRYSYNFANAAINFDVDDVAQALATDDRACCVSSGEFETDSEDEEPLFLNTNDAAHASPNVFSMVCNIFISPH